jgi:hypothetical protein
MLPSECCVVLHSAAGTGPSAAPIALASGQRRSTHSSAKLNDIDPEAWIADVLRRINDHPASELDELLPWNWQQPTADAAVA